MRATLVEEVGALPVLAELPDPEPGPGEALVRIEAACLSPVDLHIAAGRFFDGAPRVPYVPGVEGAGVVEAGDELAPGTRVRVEFVHPGYGRDGALAQYAVVPERPDGERRESQALAIPLDDRMDAVSAAALGASAWTALMILERAQRAGAQLEGAHVLVVGATGSVGQCAVQLARTMGAARIIAAGRDPARLERARQLGADATVELAGARLSQRIAAASGGRLDVALEPLWGAPARTIMQALTDGGVHVNFGQIAGSDAELPSLPLRNQRISVVGHSGAWTTPQQRIEAFERIQAIAGSEGLTMDVEELSLDQVPDGWRRLQSSAGRKLVARPSG
jgi:NADPH:quinone reductase-like Zn-dependent oxidoreductase